MKRRTFAKWILAAAAIPARALGSLGKLPTVPLVRKTDLYPVFRESDWFSEPSDPLKDIERAIAMIERVEMKRTVYTRREYRAQVTQTGTKALDKDS